MEFTLTLFSFFCLTFKQLNEISYLVILLLIINLQIFNFLIPLSNSFWVIYCCNDFMIVLLFWRCVVYFKRSNSLVNSHTFELFEVFLVWVLGFWDPNSNLFAILLNLWAQLFAHDSWAQNNCLPFRLAICFNSNVVILFTLVVVVDVRYFNSFFIGFNAIFIQRIRVKGGDQSTISALKQDNGVDDFLHSLRSFIVTILFWSFHLNVDTNSRTFKQFKHILKQANIWAVLLDMF